MNLIIRWNTRKSSLFSIRLIFKIYREGRVNATDAQNGATDETIKTLTICCIGIIFQDRSLSVFQADYFIFSYFWRSYITVWNRHSTREKVLYGMSDVIHFSCIRYILYIFYSVIILFFTLTGFLNTCECRNKCRGTNSPKTLAAT